MDIRAKLPLPHFTPSEAAALRLVAEGKTNLEIGMILGLSRFGADSRVRALREKLDASSRAQMVAAAFRLGLLE